MNIKCHHCHKPAGDLTFDNIRKMYKGTLIGGFPSYSAMKNAMKDI